jgi:hypothetical protein
MQREPFKTPRGLKLVYTIAYVFIRGKTQQIQYKFSSKCKLVPNLSLFYFINI